MCIDGYCLDVNYTLYWYKQYGKESSEMSFLIIIINTFFMTLHRNTSGIPVYLRWDKCINNIQLWQKLVAH